MQEAIKRLEAFEAMLAGVQQEYAAVAARMAALKADGREKSATYRQLMGQKLALMQMLERFKLHDLI